MCVSALFLLSGVAEAKEAAKFDGKFVDDMITTAMKGDGIPGAAFVFVKDGRIVYMKGYGVANVETKSPVDPERTVWRIGSISKTFTATAVMQLADRGMVDLHSDVNRYLTRVKVPATYPRPVTAADLLMHTAGFDEIRPGTQAADAASVLPLDEFLRTKLVRIRPPGETIAYSTYGITLAGALVEDVTHQPFAEYLRKHVFAPLGMKRTNVGAPPRGDVAVGYEMRGGQPVAQAWEWYHTTPASSVNSTAADMAKYMIAHLDEARGKLFSAATARAMHRRQLTPDPRIGGVTFGFWEDYAGSLRVIEHAGNMDGFSAQMTLIPSENAAFFLVNHVEGSHLRDDLKWGLLEHLYPAARERHPLPPPPTQLDDAAFTGRYVPIWYCHTCSPPTAPMMLEMRSEKNTLFIFGRHWIQIEPLVFERDDGAGYIAFRTDAEGKVVALFSGSFWSFEKVN